jgi:hypothetical protein
MPETLLTPSSIKLFGRVVTSLAFTNDTTAFGGNFFLQRQLAVGTQFDITGTTITNGYTIAGLAPAANLGLLTVGMTITEPGYAHVAQGTVITSVNAAAPSIGIYPAAILGAAGVGPMTVSISPKLARIYSFSFEGGYYALPKPPLFLVHGNGLPVGNWNGPSTVDQSGVSGREWDFSGNTGTGISPTTNDLFYWEYEKGDFSLRLDLDAGPFEQILLQMAFRGAGVSGAGVSGAGVSGAGVSGAGVSGAGVSGAGVSGAGVSGAGVSGAGVRR